MTAGLLESGESGKGKIVSYSVGGVAEG